MGIVCVPKFLSCVQLCDPVGCSPPGFSVPANFQARTLEWVPSPPPGELPRPGMEPASLASPALAGRFFISMPPGEACNENYWSQC